MPWRLLFVISEILAGGIHWALLLPTPSEVAHCDFVVGLIVVLFYGPASTWHTSCHLHAPKWYLAITSCLNRSFSPMVTVTTWAEVSHQRRGVTSDWPTTIPVARAVGWQRPLSTWHMEVQTCSSQPQSNYWCPHVGYNHRAKWWRTPGRLPHARGMATPHRWRCQTMLWNMI